MKAESMKAAPTKSILWQSFEKGRAFRTSVEFSGPVSTKDLCVCLCDLLEILQEQYTGQELPSDIPVLITKLQLLAGVALLSESSNALH